jgi:hypothetical protein
MPQDAQKKSAKVVLNLGEIQKDAATQQRPMNFEYRSPSFPGQDVNMNTTQYFEKDQARIG